MAFFFFFPNNPSVLFTNNALHLVFDSSVLREALVWMRVVHAFLGFWTINVQQSGEETS